MFDMRNRCATLRRLKAVTDLPKLERNAAPATSVTTTSSYIMLQKQRGVTHTIAFKVTTSSSGATAHSSTVSWSGCATPTPSEESLTDGRGQCDRCRHVDFILGGADCESDAEDY